ncbi:hypothetical protein MZM54_00045 [[Brevibacterium] frigoritolerans]|nr:hypothetical protein [Peribacillus frigoritolerans]
MKKSLEIIESNTRNTGVTHEIKYIRRDPDGSNTDYWEVKLMYQNEEIWLLLSVEGPSKLENIESERLLSWYFDDAKKVAHYETFEQFYEGYCPQLKLERAKNFYHFCKIVEFHLHNLLKEDFRRIEKLIKEWKIRDDEKIYN